MRILNATLILAAVSLPAQEPPQPPRAPRPTVAATPPAAPAPGAAPVAIATPGVPGVWTIAPVPAMPGADWAIPTPPAAAIAPTPGVPPSGYPILSVGAPPSVMIVPDELLPLYHPQSQGRTLTRIEQDRARELAELQREMARRQAERQREQAQHQAEMQREQARRQAEIAREFAGDQVARTRELARVQAEMQREQAQMQAQVQREQAQHQAEMQREQARIQADWAREQAQIQREWAQSNREYSYNYNYNFNYTPSPVLAGRTLPEYPPRSWAQNDPADSLWKLGNDLMQRGDYRKAAAVFKEIPAKFKYSQYAVDAMYWQAHALYRIGGNPDLQEALQVLESLRATYPTNRIRGNNADIGALQVRIAGVLSARGMGGSAIVRNALENNKNVCDNEEIQIRSAAMSALMQTDPAAAQDYAVKVLGKKDDCSRELRRSAVNLLGNKRDGQFTRTLIDVAKNDPSQDVRRTAIEYLGRLPGDDALAALEDLVKTSDDQEIQRSAIRALANNSSPRARNGIKALIERNDVNENQRVSALNSLSAELATTEDVNWLQGLYGKTDSQRIRTAIITAMGRLGGSANEKWFTTLANNENEPLDVRLAAIRQAGQSMDIPALGRLYDQTGQMQLRMEIVRQLGNRREPETIDKLGDILKTGTDPRIRQRAIESLMQKKDERANKLILQLIDRP